MYRSPSFGKITKEMTPESQKQPELSRAKPSIGAFLPEPGAAAVLLNIRGFARIIRFFGSSGKRDISKLYIFSVVSGSVFTSLCFGRFGNRLVVVVNDGSCIFFRNILGGWGCRRALYRRSGRGNGWWNRRGNDWGGGRFEHQSGRCFFGLCFFCKNGQNPRHGGWRMRFLRDFPERKHDGNGCSASINRRLPCSSHQNGILYGTVCTV